MNTAPDPASISQPEHEQKIQTQASAAPAALSAQQRATLARQLGHAKPATDGLLVSFGQSIVNRRQHEHPQWEDIYCANLAAYMGERMAPVLRRLLDAESEAERLRAQLADSRARALNEGAEVAVRAARAAGDSETGQYAASIAAGIGKELRCMSATLEPAREQDEEPETDEQRADRLETERDHAAGNHEYCGPTCEVAFPSEALRNGILARAIPGSPRMLNELLRRARVQGEAGSMTAGHQQADKLTPLVEINCLRSQLTERDRDLAEAMRERDHLHEVADSLAYAVAPIEEIGEHTSHNDPWTNALDLITPASEVDRLRGELAEKPAEVLRMAEGVVREMSGLKSLRKENGVLGPFTALWQAADRLAELVNEAEAHAAAPSTGAVDLSREAEDLRRRLDDAAKTRTFQTADGRTAVLVEDLAPALLGAGPVTDDLTHAVTETGQGRQSGLLTPRGRLEAMVRTDRGNMTVWSPADVRRALDAFRTDTAQAVREGAADIVRSYAPPNPSDSEDRAVAHALDLAAAAVERGHQ